MKLKWSEPKYNSTTAAIGPMGLEVAWINGKDKYGFRILQSNFTVGFSDMNQAREAAENELRKVLTQALEKLT